MKNLHYTTVVQRLTVLNHFVHCLVNTVSFEEIPKHLFGY